MTEHLQTSSRVLLICGMHRSGTSLMAGWLYRCGLDLGEEFVEPTYGNPRGHYEDLDFVGFHKRMLEAMGLDFVLKPDQELKLPQHATREAYALLREKTGRTQWGFKDPRTSLFLDFWSARLLRPRVLVMLRPWPAVVDSLLRRDLRQPAKGLKKNIIPYWHHPKNRLLVNRYLGTWIRYNEAVLGFAKTHPDDVLVVDSGQLPEASQSIYRHLTEVWNFRLEPVDMAGIWHATEFAHHVPEMHAQAKLQERAHSVWQQLLEHGKLMRQQGSDALPRPQS